MSLRTDELCAIKKCYIWYWSQQENNNELLFQYNNQSVSKYNFEKKRTLIKWDQEQ